MQDIDTEQKIRLDKWLWQARLFKTRSLASRQISAGHVRVNSERAQKPATTVRAGDVLTFAQGRTVRVIRIDAPGVRRGPATEAQTLYTDLDPPEERPPQERVAENPAYDGKGRPSKKDRRNLDLNRRSALE